MRGPLYIAAAPQAAVPGSASALHPAEKPRWARGGNRGSSGGGHSLDSRHVWGGHGADFFGFLKGVLLIKGLLFLLLVLRRKEGSCLVGCWGFKGRCSHWRQRRMHRATLDAKACGRKGEQALYFQSQPLFYYGDATSPLRQTLLKASARLK